MLFKAAVSYYGATERTGCFLAPPLTRVDGAAVNAPPKVRRSRAELLHKRLLLKVMELAVSRFFRDPGGTLVGGG